MDIRDLLLLFEHRKDLLQLLVICKVLHQDRLDIERLDPNDPEHNHLRECREESIDATLARLVWLWSANQKFFNSLIDFLRSDQEDAT